MDNICLALIIWPTRLQLMSATPKRPRPGRPRIPDAQRRVTLAVRVSQETKSRVGYLSKRFDLSMGEFIDTLVEKSYHAYWDRAEKDLAFREEQIRRGHIAKDHFS